MKKHLLSTILAASLSLPAFGNLLVNGGFESGDLTGWTYWIAPWSATSTAEVQTGVGQQGTYALHLSTANGSFGVYQAITTTPGLQYTISAKWRGNNGNLFWNEFQFFNDDGRPVYYQVDAPLNSSILAKVDGWGMNPPAVWAWKDTLDGTQWFPSGLQTATITASGTTMYVCLKAGAAGGAAEVWFDSLSVVAVPEPGSLLLLGGGLAWLILRRKSS